MTIAEASKKYQMTPDTLRYYERVGLIPPVPRTAGGIRDYDEESFRWIEFAKCMRSAGLPIEALVEYVALYRQGESTFEARPPVGFCRKVCYDRSSAVTPPNRNKGVLYR